MAALLPRIPLHTFLVGTSSPLLVNLAFSFFTSDAVFIFSIPYPVGSCFELVWQLPPQSRHSLSLHLHHHQDHGASHYQKGSQHLEMRFSKPSTVARQNGQQGLFSSQFDTQMAWKFSCSTPSWCMAQEYIFHANNALATLYLLIILNSWWRNKDVIDTFNQKLFEVSR